MQALSPIHDDVVIQDNTPPSSGSDKSNKSTVVNLNLSEMSTQQLEEYAKSLKQPRLVEFCIELGNYIRRLEQQAELREELLKRSQKQIEGRDTAIEDRDTKIGRLEKDLNLIQKVEKDILVPEKDSGNKELGESMLSIAEGKKWCD